MQAAAEQCIHWYWRLWRIYSTYKGTTWASMSHSLDS